MHGLAVSRTPARRPSGGFAGLSAARGDDPRNPRRPAPLHRVPGLYDSQFEHDACGVGFVADLSGRRTHQTVAQALTVLRNLDHRGAKGSDPDTGDGAGILTQIPDALFRASCAFALPAAGSYAAGLAFLPAGRREAGAVQAEVARLAAEEGLAVLGWRDVPHDAAHCGQGARATMPRLAQLFVAAVKGDGEAGGDTGLALDRRAFCLRKRIEHETGLYLASLSSATIVYKGMLTALQLLPFYPDLSDPAYASALALVHSRFSTNTMPSWPRAHPYRLIAHNGEINTVRGNRNWMRAREAMLSSGLFPDSLDGRGLERLLPILSEAGQRLRQLRRVPGTALPRRPVDAARHLDDDPRAVGEPRGDGPGAARVLPVPRHADGALGRSCLRRVHRRHDRGRGARPQRPAPGPVLGDPGRPGDPGQRGRRARPRPGNRGPQGAAAAGQDLPGRHRQPPHPRGCRREGGAGGRAPVRRVAARRPHAPGRPAGPAPRPARHRGTHHPAAGQRLHRGGTAAAARADGHGRGGADRLDGHRHPDRRAVRPAPAAVRLLHAALRPGHQPAAGRDQGGACHLAGDLHRRRAEPAGSRPGLVPPDRAALPGDQRQRPRQDHPHQPRRQPARVRRATWRTAATGWPAAARRCAGGWPRSAPR